MLSDLVTSHRREIFDRTAQAVARHFPERSPGIDQLPEFVSGLLAVLAVRTDREANGNPTVREASLTLARRLKAGGFSIEVMARMFGAVCDAITGLAVDLELELDARDSQLLNMCIDDAIAVGVQHFAVLSDAECAKESAVRIGFLAHEMRNALNGAAVAFEVLREGRVGVTSRTGDVLDRCLRRLTSLVGHTLAASRLEARAPLQREVYRAGALVHEAVEGLASRSSVAVDVEVDPEAEVHVDRELFLSAVGNLVQNAVKFSKAGGRVRVRLVAEADAVRIDVADECGGLGGATLEQLVEAFKRGEAGTHELGAGLGLAIVRQAVEAHGGSLALRDVPGTGCVFSVRWPRTS